MTRAVIIPLAVLLIIGNIACGQQKDADYDQMLSGMYKKTVPVIQPSQLDSIAEKENAVILDTREIGEYKVSHIRNAVWVGYNDFNTSRVKSIPKDKKVIVYCSVGYRSERIGEKLKAKGYDVYNLYGGIFQWVNEERQVYRDEYTQTQKVHPYDDKWGRWLKKGTKSYK